MLPMTLPAGDGLAAPDTTRAIEPRLVLPLPPDALDRALRAERLWLARELSDTVLRGLAGIGTAVEQAQTLLHAGDTRGTALALARLRDTVAYSLEEARHAVAGLRPPALVERDLAGALASETDRVAGQTGLRWSFSVSGTAVPLPATVEDGLLRITQAALAHVRRHATVGEVQVRLEYDGGSRCVCLTVEDDGQGFNRRHPLAGGVAARTDDPDGPALGAGYGGPAAGADDWGGGGWAALQERVRGLGGRLHVAAGPGVGTVVEVEVPYSGPVAGISGGDRPAARRPARVRVVIADDHPLARAGLRQLLAADPEIEVVGEAADGGAALAEVAALRPDVLLLDLQLGEMDGVAVLERLRAAPPPGPALVTLVLTTFDEDRLLLDAVRAGAQGYVPKGAEGPELVRAVRAAARGEALLPPALTARLLRLAQPTPPPVEPLTRRETEVLRLLAAGLGTKAIAVRLGLGAGTVKSHLEHLYGKLHVVGQGRGAAVAAARQHGLL